MKRTYWPTEEWRTAEPAKTGMNPEMLSKIDAVIKKEYGNTAGIVIVKNGYIVYEKYYNAYGPDDTIHVASVTKSILSAVTGIALDKGFIQNIDQPVLDFFPDYKVLSGEDKKREVTLRHLLTMTASYSYESEPFSELCSSPDWIKYALDLLDGTKQTGVFKYSTVGAHILSAVITRCTGKSVREFANEHLFAPLGMKILPDYFMKASEYMKFFMGAHVNGWVVDPSGNSTGGWGLTLTPRDMARFGFLYLNRGVWDNRRILPEKWIDETTAMNQNHYGYMWWLFNEADFSAYCALGDGGNVICLIPEKDLVIAIASTLVMNPKDRLTLIKEYILSAVTL